MNYGYGPASASPYINPYWSQNAWGGFGGYGGFGNQYWNPSFGFGYGTYPFAGPSFFPNLTWARPNDDEIKYFVENSLDNDPNIPTHVNIGVDVRNGVVTLTGTVPNKRVKHAAGDDAWWIPQVLDVHNEINVVPRRERMGTTTPTETTPTTSTGRRTSTTGR